MKAYRGSRDLVPLFLDRATRYLEESGQFHVLAALSMGKFPPILIE
jgi:hypothetical protein